MSTRPSSRAFLPFAVAIGGAAVAVLSGCGSQNPLMPLNKGRKLTYVVRAGFDAKVEEFTVSRRLPVAGVEGAEVLGPIGESRLAWKNGVLVAESTANGWFRPAIPLLAEDKKDRSWHGRLVGLDGEKAANATLNHRKETIILGNRKVETVLAVLTLRVEKATIELESYYEPGVGLVKQEQRTNGKRVVQVELLKKP